MTLIVVGYDGSSNARAALDFAAAEAAAHGATLRIVGAWHTPGLWVDPYSLKEQIEQVGQDAEQQVSTEADRIERALGRPVQRHVECGSATDVLVREAADADLLVVGARGRGGFVGLLVGSVANQVVHHAPCPVVVVPAPTKA